MITVPLGELSRPKQWRTLSKAEMVEEGFPVYGANGVIGYAQEFTHAEPTLLIGCRGTIGAIHICAPNSFVTGNAMALDCLAADRIDIKYLARFLSWRGLDEVASGSSQPQLTRQNLVTVEIPLPHLTEQRRIAAILDQADAIRTKRRQVLAHLDSLTQSTFRAAFMNVSEATRLGDLAVTTSGGTPNRSVSANYGGGIPWVKSGELHAGLVTDTEETLSEQGLSSSSAKVFPVGTVLLAMYGATAGVVGRLGVSAATNQAICAITPGPSLHPDYLIAALRAQTVQLVAKATGGAQPNLSQGIIRDMLIPLPAMDDQERFARQAAAIATRRSDVVRAIQIGDELFAVLQSRAFRGEL